MSHRLAENSLRDLQIPASSAGSSSSRSGVSVALLVSLSLSQSASVSLGLSLSKFPSVFRSFSWSLLVSLSVFLSVSLRFSPFSLSQYSQPVSEFFPVLLPSILYLSFSLSSGSLSVSLNLSRSLSLSLFPVSRNASLPPSFSMLYQPLSVFLGMRLFSNTQSRFPFLSKQV